MPIRSPRNRFIKLFLYLSLASSCFLLFSWRGVQRQIRSHLTNSDRLYTRCHFENIPYISPLLETAEFLRFTNVSLARIGNGEILLMVGRKRQFQAAQKTLSDALMKVMVSDIPNLAIGLPDILSGFPEMKAETIGFWNKNKVYSTFLLKHAKRSKQYLHAMITAPYKNLYGTYCSIIPAIYDNLREIWKNKDIILLRGDNGEEYQYDIYDTARSKKEVLAPPLQAWDSYRSLRSRLMAEDSSNLFILAAGPVSKVLAYDLATAGRRALDMGHLAKDYNAFKTGIIPNDFWRANVAAGWQAENATMK